MSEDNILPIKSPKTLSPEEVERLTFDLSSGIHKPETVAARYGFRTVNDLKNYLGSHPWIVEDAQRRKALLDSDQGTTDRVVLKSLIAVEETIPSLAGIVMDPKSAPKDRIDAFKELRQAGNVGGSKDKKGVTGTQFSLTINMPGGVQEKIIGEVVEPQDDE